MNPRVISTRSFENVSDVLRQAAQTQRVALLHTSEELTEILQGSLAFESSSLQPILQPRKPLMGLVVFHSDSQCFLATHDDHQSLSPRDCSV